MTADPLPAGAPSPPPPLGAAPYRTTPANHGWYEASEDEELEPGDLGGGVGDLEAGSYLTPRRTRRVPLSFTAVVLLLTLTTGIGMAAGLLTGPNPWHVIPEIGHNGSGNGTGGSGGHNGTPGNNGTKPPANGSSTTPGKGNQSSGNGTSGNGGHGGNTTNRTGNTSGGSGNSSSSGNGTGGNGTGGHGGNGTGGNGNGNGNGGTSGNGTGGTGGNGTKPPPHNGTPGNRSVIVYRTILPWLPDVHPNWLLIGVGLSLGGLAVAVFAESIRPPPDRGNPWRGQMAPAKRGRPRRRPVSPREALDLAVQKLREELHAYTLRYGTSGDALVRERIIQLYAALLTALAPGLGDLDGRTPREVEWLAVRYLSVRQGTAHELTWLFEEARYSTHPLPPEGVTRAEHALTALMVDLEAQRLWD